MADFAVKDLVDLFYHPRFQEVLDSTFKKKLIEWQKELKAENATAMGQILSHYPTVMLVGPAQSGKTSLVSGMLHFEQTKRSQWINKNAGTGAVSKTKVPTRYVQKSDQKADYIDLQPEMEKEIRRIFEDILVASPKKLEEDKDKEEKKTAKIIMTNQPHAVRKDLIRKDGAFSILDMPGTAACGSNLEELFSNTRKQKYRVFNLIKERYLLYRVFPDVAQILLIVAPLQNLGASKWAQEDVIDKFLSKHLQEPCSLKEIIKKYKNRTILCIPDLNKWNRRENWEKEYWQSLESLGDQLGFENLDNVVFIRSPEVDEAYENLYDSVFEDLSKSSFFKEVLSKQGTGFKSREDRGFSYLSEKIWESLQYVQEVASLRNTIVSECTSKIQDLGLARKEVNLSTIKKILPYDEIEYLNGQSKKLSDNLKDIQFKKLELQGNYSEIYHKIGAFPPKKLYELMQKIIATLGDSYFEDLQNKSPASKDPKKYIILLDEKDLEHSGEEWKKLKQIWEESDFPLATFEDRDFQEAYRILLYQSTLGSKKKILYPYRIQPIPDNEKALFLARPLSFVREEEHPLDMMDVQTEEKSTFPFQITSLPFSFSLLQSAVWKKDKLENFLIFFHHHSPETFLSLGRYSYLQKKKLLRSYKIEDLLQKFKKQELTLLEIFQFLEIKLENSLVLIEYEENLALVC